MIKGITPSGAGGTVMTVTFGSVATSDVALKAAGVHLPLELNAQEFYDLNSVEFASKLDFTESRAAYTPATQLEPECHPACEDEPFCGARRAPTLPPMHWQVGRLVDRREQALREPPGELGHDHHRRSHGDRGSDPRPPAQGLE